MRALVTGHKGFVGRHLVAALKAAPWCEHAFGMDTADMHRNGDVRRLVDPHAWHGSRGKMPYDIVFHCAALVGGREGIDGNPAMLAATNLQLDGAMFEWALRTRPGRLVYFSSAAAYPTRYQMASGARPLAERDLDPQSPCPPDASYGWVKLTGERIAHEVRKAGVPVTIVRPFSSYGGDQDLCYPFRVMTERAQRHDDPFVVWGDGSQVRDFIHIDDLVAALLTLAHDGVDGPVNLGTGKGTSMDELARLMMGAAGYGAPIEHLLDKPVGVRYRVADTRFMREFYTPRVSLEEGVARAVQSA
jgi:nucleoside-diphosphate-sugar epimerase